MATQTSNRFRYEMLKGGVDCTSDVFKIILMQSGFSYDRVNDGTYSDVSADELTTANGYTAGGATLSGVSVSQDDVQNRGEVTWSDVSWTASGGSIVASGAIIYDDTHANDIVVAYIDFSSDQTALDGGAFVIADIEVYNGDPE